MVSFSSNHFWRCIAGRPTGCFESRSHLVHVAETEVDYFECQIVVEEEVFGLEVSVADAALVYIFNARYQLQVELASLLLRQPRMPHNIIKQLAATAVLHDHIEFFFGFNYFVELNDIGVPHLLQNLDLPRNPLNILLIINFVLLEYLDGHLLASQRVLAQLDLPERSFPEVLAWKKKQI